MGWGKFKKTLCFESVEAAVGVGSRWEEGGRHGKTFHLVGAFGDGRTGDSVREKDQPARHCTPPGWSFRPYGGPVFLGVHRGSVWCNPSQARPAPRLYRRRARRRCREFAHRNGDPVASAGLHLLLAREKARERTKAITPGVEGKQSLSMGFWTRARLLRVDAQLLGTWGYTSWASLFLTVLRVFHWRLAELKRTQSQNCVSFLSIDSETPECRMRPLHRNRSHACFSLTVPQPWSPLAAEQARLVQCPCGLGSRVRHGILAPRRATRVWAAWWVWAFQDPRKARSCGM